MRFTGGKGGTDIQVDWFVDRSKFGTRKGKKKITSTI